MSNDIGSRIHADYERSLNERLRAYHESVDAAVATERAELLAQLMAIDEGLAARYASARDRDDEYNMDNIACERVGLQSAINLIRSRP